MLPIPGGPDGRDSAREIQGLSRGAERLSLRELRERLEREGPLGPDVASLSSEEIRCEIAALSTCLIEETFAALWTLLGDSPTPLLEVNGAGDGFQPLRSLPPGEDPLRQVALAVDVLLSATARFCEHRLGGAPTSPQGALYLRYREVLARLRPPSRPVDHAIGNGLAGLQIVLALCEVPRAVHERQLGAPLPWPLQERLLLSPDFERLVLAIGATRSRAANCLLAELCGDAFWSWRHSLRAPGAPRLRFLPERFSLDLSGPAPVLQVLPGALEAVRRRMDLLETPGRERQIMCPAFFAEAGGVVIQEFVRWVLAIVQHHHEEIWPA